MSQPPNIVYIHGHDIGRHVEPYGYGVQTPNIQRLAEEGVHFRQAFSAAPTCSPSRAALLTGQAPHSAGMLGLAHRGFRLNDPRQHLAAWLSGLGYMTILAGTQHVTSGDLQELGYQLVSSPANTNVDSVAPIAARYLQQLGSETDLRPFFLDAGFTEAHRSFPEVGPEDSRFVKPVAPIPDTAETRMDTAGFLTGVREFDRGVGMILQALDHAGLAESTLVICTTDHGPAFPGMKANLTDHGLGVMLILRGPAEFAGGKVIDALVGQIDLFPTICGLSRTPRPDWLQGASLVPLVTGQTHQIHDEVFAESTFHAAYEPQRSIRTERWRYIRRYGDGNVLVMPNVDHSPSRDLWMDYGWGDRAIDRNQLYDCMFDPDQSCNIAGDPASAHIREEMANRLDRWMHETDDPLLAGSVELPAGATVNRTSARSPDEELVTSLRD